MDLTQQPSRPHIELLMLTNRMLTSTTEQLNNFASLCESKLQKVHQKVLRRRRRLRW